MHQVTNYRHRHSSYRADPFPKDLTLDPTVDLTSKTCFALTRSGHKARRISIHFMHRIPFPVPFSRIITEINKN